jgi:hypothetical protein
MLDSKAEDENWWVGAGQNLAREIGRNIQHAVDLPIAQVAVRRGLVAVGDGVEGPGVDRDGLAHFFHLDGRNAVVLIDDANAQVLDFSPEGVAKDDELNQRHDHRDDDEDGAAAKSPQVALDDGPDSDHPCPRARMNGLCAALGACKASRIWCPV